MELRCYLCDSQLKGEGRPFKIGAKEEYICASCYTKTVNRQKALGHGRPG